jgi:hypothetical protein
MNQLRLLVILPLALALGGCTLVKPYQRELLSQPGMSLAVTPDSDAEQHLLESREASVGGFGSAGGGCGCN